MEKSPLEPWESQTGSAHTPPPPPQQHSRHLLSLPPVSLGQRPRPLRERESESWTLAKPTCLKGVWPRREGLS